MNQKINNYYKNTMCFWVLLSRQCPDGNNCQWAHSKEEIRCFDCHQEVCSCIKISQKYVMPISTGEQVHQEKPQTNTNKHTIDDSKMEDFRNEKASKSDNPQKKQKKIQEKIHENYSNEKIRKDIKQNNKIKKAQASPGQSNGPFQMQGYSEVQAIEEEQTEITCGQCFKIINSLDSYKQCKESICYECMIHLQEISYSDMMEEQQYQMKFHLNDQYFRFSSDPSWCNLVASVVNRVRNRVGTEHNNSKTKGTHKMVDKTDDNQEISFYIIIPELLYNGKKKCYILAIDQIKGCEPNIHGLWSSVIDYEGDKDLPNNNYKPADLLLSEIEDLRPYLEKHMKSNIKGPNILAENWKFWKHELEKHGQFMWVAMDVHEYFYKTLELFFDYYLAIKQKQGSVKCIKTGELQLVFGMDFNFIDSNFRPKY